RVSYEQSLEHIAAAALCVLVEADLPEGVFLPSKLCDYLAARKPVLALSPDRGTVSDLAEHGGVRRVRPDDSRGVRLALVDLFDAFEERRLEQFRPPDALVHRFTAGAIVSHFLALARAVIGRGSVPGLRTVPSLPS